MNNRNSYGYIKSINIYIYKESARFARTLLGGHCMHVAIYDLEMND